MKISSAMTIQLCDGSGKPIHTEPAGEGVLPEIILRAQQYFIRASVCDGRAIFTPATIREL